PVAGRVDPQKITVLKRNPIPFKPFEMKDPKTGAPISPSTMITLPNGKSMTAAVYYAELNKWEKAFNAIGYSLRDTQKEIVLQKSTITADLPSQARRVAASHQRPGANGVHQLIDPTYLENKFRQELNSDPDRLRGLRSVTVRSNDPCASDRAR